MGLLHTIACTVEMATGQTVQSDVKKKGYLYKLPVSGGVIKVTNFAFACKKHASPFP